MRLNAPETFEGAQVWDLVLRCGGQLRATQGRIIGYDLSAVFSMADALCIPRAAVAEFVPKIEAAAVTAMNQSADDQMEQAPNGAT